MDLQYIAGMNDHLMRWYFDLMGAISQYEVRRQQMRRLWDAAALEAWIRYN